MNSYLRCETGYQEGNHTVVAKVEVNNVVHAKLLSERKRDYTYLKNNSFLYEVHDTDQETCIFLLSLIFTINTKAVNNWCNNITIVCKNLMKLNN